MHTNEVIVNVGDDLAGAIAALPIARESRVRIVGGVHALASGHADIRVTSPTAISGSLRASAGKTISFYASAPLSFIDVTFEIEDDARFDFSAINGASLTFTRCNVASVGSKGYVMQLYGTLTDARLIRVMCAQDLAMVQRPSGTTTYHRWGVVPDSPFTPTSCKDAIDLAMLALRRKRVTPFLAN